MWRCVIDHLQTGRLFMTINNIHFSILLSYLHRNVSFFSDLSMISDLFNFDTSENYF